MQLFGNGKNLFACFLVTTLLCSGLGLGPIASFAIAKVQAKESTEESAENIIRSKLQELASAATKCDAAAMAALWSANATYVDEHGDATVGRESLKNRFEEGFKSGDPVTTAIETESLSVLSDNAIVTKGVVNKIGIGDLPYASTRFMMVFKKEDGNWLISNGIETTINQTSNEKLLKEISWIIGRWTAERNQEKVSMTARWIGKGNFMLLSFVIEKPGQPKVQEAQVIGWDPIEHGPISWSFDASGGFGNGHWYKQDNKWHVEVSGVHSDGSETNAVNIFTIKDNDSFTWQSTSRSIENDPLPDSAVIKVVRVK